MTRRNQLSLLAAAALATAFPAASKENNMFQQILEVRFQPGTDLSAVGQLDGAPHAEPRGDATLRFVLWSTPFGMALLLPSLWWLFRVFKGDTMGPARVGPRADAGP